jgi:outer membrane protein assembly factor BamD
MKFLNLATLRNFLLPFAALSLFLLASPAAHAQVATPQTGGSGQSDTDSAPPPADKPADAKPADAAPATAPTAAPAAAPAAGGTPASTTKKSKLPFKHTKTSSSTKAAKPAKTTSEEKDANGGAEPDKVLYDRAQDDLKHGRYTEGRLALQTLVNTYPDSEYLAKAKLMVADSYYKEGGTGNLTQAIQEYKDFQTFFPFLENEASYAQMQVGLAHYHMMEKADRDTTQAQEAEDEFQAFLVKYPQSPLVPKAEQYLRDVQEILADGEFKIAYYYYYTKQDYRASAARLVELSDRYPLYSENDQALWMLGDIYDRARQLSKNEDDKNHWGDLAAKCYDRIVTEYPLSKQAPDAQARLKAMGKPVPAADGNALVREQQQIAYEKAHKTNPVMRNGMGMLNGNPDTTMAARYGAPQLNPPDDAVSATDVLKSGAQGPSFTVQGGSARASSDDSSGVVVEDATSTGHAVDPNADAQTGVGAEIITPVDDKAQPTSEAPRQPQADVPAASETPAAATATLDNNAAASGSGSAASAAGTTPPAATPTPSNPSAESTSGAPAGTPAGSSSSSQAPASSTASPDASAAKASTADSSSGESSSKKKKGIKKILPFSKGQ